MNKISPTEYKLYHPQVNTLIRGKTHSTSYSGSTVSLSHCPSGMLSFLPPSPCLSPSPSLDVSRFLSSPPPFPSDRLGYLKSSTPAPRVTRRPSLYSGLFRKCVTTGWEYVTGTGDFVGIFVCNVPVEDSAVMRLGTLHFDRTELWYPFTVF